MRQTQRVHKSVTVPAGRRIPHPTDVFLEGLLWFFTTHRPPSRIPPSVNVFLERLVWFVTTHRPPSRILPSVNVFLERLV